MTFLAQVRFFNLQYAVKGHPSPRGICQLNLNIVCIVRLHCTTPKPNVIPKADVHHVREVKH